MADERLRERETGVAGEGDGCGGRADLVWDGGWR